MLLLGTQKGVAMTSLMMKRKDVVGAVGLCYTSIYNMEKVGKFPARRQISTGRVAWVRKEVEDWIGNLQCVSASVA